MSSLTPLVAEIGSVALVVVETHEDAGLAQVSYLERSKSASGTIQWIDVDQLVIPLHGPLNTADDGAEECAAWVLAHPSTERSRSGLTTMFTAPVPQRIRVAWVRQDEEDAGHLILEEQERNSMGRDVWAEVCRWWVNERPVLTGLVLAAAVGMRITP